MSRSNENVIEWLTGQDKAALTLGQDKYINRVKRFAKKHPDKMDYVENDDCSIFAHVPLSWIKITPPRELTDEQKADAAVRLSRIRPDNKA